MRPGIIIAIAAAVAIVVGGLFWYGNQPGQAGLEEQRAEQAALTAREDERLREEDTARQEEDTARQEERAREEGQVQEGLARDQELPGSEEDAVPSGQAIQEAEDPASLAARDGAAETDAAAAADDNVIVVGDEITEGAIVVESETRTPIILDPENTATGVDVGADAATNASAVTGDTTALPVEGDGVTEGAGTDGSALVTGAATTTDPEQLLTPENFDRDQVLALIDNAEQLTSDQRSTLRAVTEGTSANPAMVDAAIDSIRAALDLPPLN